MQRTEMREAFKGQEKIKITLLRSLISEKPTNKRTLLAMGLRRPNKSVILPNHDSVWGMIFKVGPMVKVEKVTDK